MLSTRVLVATVFALAASVALADDTKSFDAAAAFGTRPSVSDISLSPDGLSVAYITPTQGQGSVLYTRRLGEGGKSLAALAVSGKPERLDGCGWVSNDRLICEIYGVTRGPTELLPFTRMWAINADGSKPQQLSSKRNFNTRGLQLGGGEIIDWLPDQDGAVLMTRVHLPDDHIGSNLGSSVDGLGVDLVDTRTLTSRSVERPLRNAVEYISDGRGTVRIMGLNTVMGATGQDAGVISYHYRLQGSRDWQELCTYNYTTREGFNPFAVDRDRNVAYGFRKSGGRLAFYSLALDGSMDEELIFARPDVDVDELISIGRRHRVIGVSYATDYRQAAYFDADIQKLIASLQRALVQHPSIQIVDASVDETRLVILASSDTDPGTYYLFDRQSHRLEPFVSVRAPLDGVALATVKPVHYPATDGTLVPGYLTLPPGTASARGLPAIVMPHGGPSARDEWGFDWLAQFYASRGFAVLQPNFRGSLGYGDDWFGQNAFHAWPTAISDVLDGGRWLVAQGIDPAKLGIVGWSYGGYAALQSAVTDASVFKAVVAIAPVTDLQQLKNERRDWSDYYLRREIIGDGPQVREGSPARNAEKIKVPVMLFHGTLDRNVAIAQSQGMAKSLEAAHVPHQLVTFEGLDHALDDSGARAEMLRESEEFLRRSFGAPDK